MSRHRRRRHEETPEERLRRYVNDHEVSVRDALADHGYLISPGYLEKLLDGQISPGEEFLQAFFESTGIRLSN